MYFSKYLDLVSMCNEFVHADSTNLSYLRLESAGIKRDLGLRQCNAAYEGIQGLLFADQIKGV
jgi:hypothetical protein